MQKLKMISEILKEVESISSRKAKVEKLRTYDNNVALKSILKGAYDPRIEWLLPSGIPPYKEAEDMIRDPGGLYREYRKFYIFTKGRNSDNISQIKRESLFIQTLEKIHPDEAKVLLAVKEKSLPYKGITAKLVQEAFPGLINE